MTAPGLAGLRVLVTASGGRRLVELLERSGAAPHRVPTIAIRWIEDERIDAALRRAGSYDWIVLTSPNGVKAIGRRLARLDLEPPSGPRWAAVGPRTAADLAALGVRVAAVPDAGRSAAIPDAMGDVSGLRILLLRSASASAELPAKLRERGGDVDDVTVYRTVEGPESSRGPLARALAEGVDAVVFTSGSTVRGFARLAGDPARALAGTIVVALGPVTARAARAAGLADVRVSDDRSPAALAAALAEASAGARRG